MAVMIISVNKIQIFKYLEGFENQSMRINADIFLIFLLLGRCSILGVVRKQVLSTSILIPTDRSVLATVQGKLAQLVIVCHFMAQLTACV